MSITAAIVTLDPESELPFAAQTSLAALAGAGVRVAYVDASDALVAPDADAASTWVLTSSSEVVDAAHKLGFSTCAVLDEGVALADKAFDAANIVAHGWAEVTAELLDDFAQIEGEIPKASCRVLIVSGSPEVSSPELVASLATEADYVIACDAGAKVCKEAGVAPQVFVGDGDSAGAETLAWIHAVVDRCITFPEEKYATDLALALDAARHEAARREARLRVTLTCTMGGRPDHALAVLGLLLFSHDAGPRVVEDALEMRILTPEGTPCWQLGEDAVGHTLSVVALAPQTVVTETGMRWDLIDRELPLLGDEGISNIVAEPDAQIVCYSGALAVFLLR